MSKKPSDRSIRSALTVLKRASIISGNIEYLSNDKSSILLVVDNNLLSPKRSIRKRLPKVKKVRLPDQRDNPVHHHSLD